MIKINELVSLTQSKDIKNNLNSISEIDIEKMRLLSKFKKKEGEFHLIKKEEYSDYVNFKNNLDKKFHNWFYLKEGYSSELVSNLFKRFNIKKNMWVLDVFAGCGTTLLTSQEQGINSVGIELNPFLSFLIKSKLTTYNLSSINYYYKKIKNVRLEINLSPPNLSITNKLFGDRLNLILSYKNFIDNIKNKNTKMFFKTALLSILEDVSSAKKDGNGLRYPKNKIPKDVRKSYLDKLEKMICDIKKRKKNKAKYVLINGDSTNLMNLIIKNNELNNLKNKVDFSIFSPPYLNCFDYTEVYKVELWIGDFVKDYADMRKLRNKTLHSHLNSLIEKDVFYKNRLVEDYISIIEKKKLWDDRIPLMIRKYFEDMFLVLNGVYKMLKKNSYCVIVIGNSSYGEFPLPTDIILADISLQIGFRKAKIEISRILGTSSQQISKIRDKDLLRESLVILQK